MERRAKIKQGPVGEFILTPSENRTPIDSARSSMVERASQKVLIPINMDIKKGVYAKVVC